MADEAQQTDVTAPTGEPADKSTAPVESSTTETKETKELEKPDLSKIVPDEEEDQSDEGDDTGDDDDDTSDDQEDSQDSEEEKLKGAEARKVELNNEIRGLVAKRNELRQEVSRLNEQAYRTQTKEELIDEGLSEAEAAEEALKQQLQMTNYNTYVSDLNANLNIESLQVMADFPVFDPDSPLYDEALTTRARAVYEKAAGIQTDKRTGLITKANVLPYEIFKAFAETAQSTTKVAEAKAQKAAEKNLAAADTPSSTAPKQKAEDPFLKGLLGNRS